jgi:hypothetical protein
VSVVECIEVVRAAMRAANAGDVEGVVALCSPTCELHVPEGLFVGHDGVRQFLQTRHGARDATSLAVPTGKPEDVGQGKILVPLVMHTEIGGEAIDVRATAIWTVKDGLIDGLEGSPGGRRAALRMLGRSIDE